jgi:HPt (histidine-containing phosphotransfer) domain-containing protein
MLERLLDEFSDLAIPAPADAVALSIQGGRMHKLRGSAGMLGAKAVQQVAGEAETACVAGEIELARQLGATLEAMLQRLRRSAAPAFTAAREAGDEPAPAGGAELDPQLLVDLVHLLREQNLAAIDSFSAISPQLRRLLGKTSYDRVCGHMANLRFDDAANTLQPSRL